MNDLKKQVAALEKKNELKDRYLKRMKEKIMNSGQRD